mgnify:CR=1 FL=1
MELPNLFPQLYDLDLIIAPSHYAALHHSVQSAVARLPPARQPRVAVVTPGVDAAIYGNVQEAACPHECSLNRSSWPQNWERVDAPGCAASCEIVGFLARLSPEKSPGLLVHAASIILAQRPLARVVFVGDGAARSQCELLTRAYGLEHRVSFVGAVYGAEKVASYYASFDLIVQPALRAWSETFCIANLEAMASARPVVSFGVGGVGVGAKLPEAMLRKLERRDNERKANERRRDSPILEVAAPAAAAPSAAAPAGDGFWDTQGWELGGSEQGAAQEAQDYSELLETLREVHLNNNAQPRGGAVGLHAVGGAQGAAVPGATTPEFEMEHAAAEAEGGADSDEADEADLLAAGMMSGAAPTPRPRRARPNPRANGAPGPLRPVYPGCNPQAATPCICAAPPCMHAAIPCHVPRL